MKTAWIIGAGKFGRLAAKRLRNKFNIVIVDKDESLLHAMDALKISHARADGVEYLMDNLKHGVDVSWIIPALPIHLAWEWCWRKIGQTQLKPQVLSDKILPFLPHPIKGKSSHIYTSHADFICPDNCNEPDSFCTYTEKPRKKDMDQLLESLSFGSFEPLVLKSKQLAPGVGGYQPEDLFRLLNRIKQLRGSLLICTACRCHGVITGAVHL